MSEELAHRKFVSQEEMAEHINNLIAENNKFKALNISLIRDKKKLQAENADLKARLIEKPMTNNSREQAAREWANNKLSTVKNLSELPSPVDIFLAGCEHEAKRDKWVSVKERLPDSNSLVLCCAIGSLRPTYGWYHDNIGKWTVNDEPNHNYTKVDRISFVTHWQPLPKEPNTDE